MTLAGRRAAVNKWLLIILVCAGLAAAGFWAYRLLISAGDTPSLAVDADAEYMLWCSSCKAEFAVPAREAKAVPKQDGKLQCPQCKKFTGSWGRPEQSAPSGSGIMRP
jgi:hypothetical protein